MVRVGWRVEVGEGVREGRSVLDGVTGVGIAVREGVMEGSTIAGVVAGVQPTTNRAASTKMNNFRYNTYPPITG
jgi:hypothetical protein